MNIRTTLPAFLLLVCLSMPLYAGADGLVVQASLSTNRIVLGDDLTVTVTVSTSDDRKQKLDFGSFAEYFGIYILGPWGPVVPNPQKARTENFMHGEHSASKIVVIEKNNPFTIAVKLSEYFRIEKPTRQGPGMTDGFLPGKYQINVKFFAQGLGLPTPLDSGPMTFIVEDKPAPKPPEAIGAESAPKDQR